MMKSVSYAFANSPDPYRLVQNVSEGSAAFNRLALKVFKDFGFEIFLSSPQTEFLC